MENRTVPRIENADRLHGGVIITFDDGKCAVYPTSLLLAIFPNAEEIIDPDPEE